nr:hybrid signal transduction histidine kinase M [Tanacetum cinerariifolium]
LDSRFATLVDIIRHRETLPSFETTRNVLLLKESSFKDDTRTSSTFDDSSSSPTALVTSTSSTPKGSSSKSHTLPQLCNHFIKGTCRFGDRCKYIHDHRNRVGLSSTRYQSRSTASSHAGVWNTARIQHRTPCFIVQALIQLHCWPNCLLHRPSPLLIPAIPPVHQPAQQAQFLQPQSAHQPGILRPPPSQATTLHSAFSTMTL